MFVIKDGEGEHYIDAEWKVLLTVAFRNKLRLFQALALKCNYGNIIN